MDVPVLGEYFACSAKKPPIANIDILLCRRVRYHDQFQQLDSILGTSGHLAAWCAAIGRGMEANRKDL
jgi:hypothetical protein